MAVFCNLWLEEAIEVQNVTRHAGCEREVELEGQGRAVAELPLSLDVLLPFTYSYSVCSIMADRHDVLAGFEECSSDGMR